MSPLSNALQRCGDPDSKVATEDLTALSTATFTANTPSSVDASSVTTADATLGAFDGVSVLLMSDAPAWLQRRYPMLVSNALANTPPTWAVQIVVKVCSLFLSLPRPVTYTRNFTRMHHKR